MAGVEEEFHAQGVLVEVPGAGESSTVMAIWPMDRDGRLRDGASVTHLVPPFS